MEHEDFVTYEQAVKLKGLGFDWKCNHWYNYLKELKTTFDYYASNQGSFQKMPDHADAPTLAQVTKWLRANFNLFVHVYLHLDDCWRYELQCIFNHENYMYEPDAGLWWRSYEQALSAGIDKALEFLNEE